MKGKLLFEEEQSFLGTWMWYLTIGIAVLTIIGTVFSWLYSNEPDGAIGTIIATIVLGGVIALFATSKLYTTIDEHKIYYRYPPFVSHEKSLSKEDVLEIRVRKYHPIREYGGWGYRFRFRSGRALSVAGNKGLQMLTSKNKRILIGTQKPEEMERAVRRLKENWGMDG